MDGKDDRYWELFWRTGLPEAYVMSRRDRRNGQKGPGVPEGKDQRGG